MEAAYSKAFDKFDRDGSGRIEKAELGALCASLGARLSADDLTSAMDRLDRDASGVIEKEEFMRWWMDRKADLDGDGRVDAVESSLARVSLRGTDDALRAHIEDIRADRDAVHRQILKLEEEKAAIQRLAVELQDQLAHINESLTANYHQRAQLDSVVGETEAAYMKILEGSKALVETIRMATPRLPDPLRDDDAYDGGEYK